MGTSADLMGSSQCHPVYIDNKPYSVQLCPATPAFQALPAPHPAISSSYPEISIYVPLAGRSEIRPGNASASYSIYLSLDVLDQSAESNWFIIEFIWQPQTIETQYIVGT